LHRVDIIHDSPLPSAICISLDNTFKITAKATVVDKNGTHTRLLKGGILSVINEANEIIAWVSSAGQRRMKQAYQQ
jgi:hypothetical protein